MAFRAPLSNGFRFHLRTRRLTCRTFASLMSPPPKAVVYKQQGPPDQVTRVIDLPPVEIKEHDVCVKMLAAPINPSDINKIEGSTSVVFSILVRKLVLIMMADNCSFMKCEVGGVTMKASVYPVRPPVPAIGGYEGVGEIYALGSAVKNFSVGDKVIPSPPSFGTWQTYIVKEESVWHKISKDAPIEYAATVTVNPLTALRMLDDFVKLAPGEVLAACLYKQAVSQHGVGVSLGRSHISSSLVKLVAYSEDTVQGLNPKFNQFFLISWGHVVHHNDVDLERSVKPAGFAKTRE
ncbi:hypothetical protein ACLOJK_020814 [Asimina triloba]